MIASPARDALARLLAAAPPTHLTAVAGDMFESGQFSADFSWRDTVAVVDRIAAMPVSADGVPPLLTFAARVGAELSGHLAVKINLWVDAVAEGIGVDRAAVLADLRQSLTEPETVSNNGAERILSGEDSGAAAVTGRNASTLVEPTGVPQGSGGRLRIWAGVPARNPTFTGRETLLLALHRALERRSKASVLPRALHGTGGVGKTQLAAEFAYRYADRYDIVWWIPAEQQSMVVQSLHELGRHLGTPQTADLQQTASLVLEELASSPLRWLLVYDNANEPEDVARLMPVRGGHVILTSRNQTWSEVWDPVQVGVFSRPESVELVRRRRENVSPADADRLAARLGDLPLALDQAVSCQVATGMSVGDYLAELEEHARELAAAGSPRTTLVAVVRLTIRRLRVHAPAVAELLELFAFLGAEPISGGLLRRGREARVSPALGRALREQIAWDRAIRDLRRYGLAKVDPDQRIQMHRLFQGVLRDELKPDVARRGRANVQHLLASANPGYPLDEATWPVHAEIGPHIGPAGLVDSELLDARRVVLDQVRYLNVIGDLEGCRRLGEMVVDAWSKVEGVRGLGPDGEMTLRASLYLSITLRHLGFNERARSLTENALERFRANSEFGPDHEHTLYAASVLAPNLRVAGLFREALALDEENVARHRAVFGDEDEETVNARSNLAVNLRLLGDFAGAHAIDSEAARIWQQVVGDNDNRLLFVQANLARDLYGLGRYAEALRLLRGILPPFRQQLGTRHPYVMLADRTLAIALRKVGRYDEALVVAAEHDRDSERRYGPQHERALAAAMTHANTLRVAGDLAEAHRRTDEAMDRYLLVFGEGHPLTLAAAVNHAIVLRGVRERARARDLDERTYARMREVLGPEHGYTLCAASGLANDLALAGETEAAWRLSAQTLRISRRARGQPHPYTLACAVNAAIDTIAIGRRGEGQASLDDAVAALAGVLGADHPETLAAREGHRAESDIEPSPT
ncbi:FxSxx-COOH system tetratricopeptide repeat protein [Phytohabitans sp. ZYX-F-186]|uniref:FxSxx-COOH system tetratricopeptide repeat protein n=1 Tax=Phytohabitans maris TaxID=3071409 RepID=A0ABU0ZEP4_9ACTN|nr:FxSxx-COOH system tetratricopeptide repeat protein [Phytohabitans sp. ZYX-F-186]MDQ7904911.1 FxSxx-COOH system tetratricopeptide repeat protein [Phytohabitans sp. ZYX-F-186]